MTNATTVNNQTTSTQKPAGTKEKSEHDKAKTNSNREKKGLCCK